MEIQRAQIQFSALGSEIFLTLVGDQAKFGEIFSLLRQRIEQFEQRFSRFLPSSELSRFNRRAGEPVKISAEFRAILRTARDLAKRTDGRFNPFILPDLQRSGYGGAWPKPETFDEILDFSRRRGADFSKLKIGQDFAKIPTDTALDLGGIGKGFLLDQLNQFLVRQSLTGYWLSLGGDIVCAGRDLDGRNWQIQVASAETGTTNTTIENFTGQPLFIATSGITKRRGVGSEKSWHHLIDPRTGRPAETDILTATVVADSGAAADVLAKVIVIAGRDCALELKKAGQISRAVMQYANLEKEEI